MPAFGKGEAKGGRGWGEGEGGNGSEAGRHG